MLVLYEDWKLQCQAAGIIRKRFKEVRDALVNRGSAKSIRSKCGHTVLVAAVSAKRMLMRYNNT